MSQTYDPTHSSDGGLNEARFDLGDIGHIKDDTGAAVYLLQDAEITGKIATYGYNEGVAQCAESCVMRTAQEPDLYEDEQKTRVQWTKRQGAWEYLAARLRSRIGAPATATLTPITVAAGVTAGPSNAGMIGIPLPATRY